jgi:hypothetical protein
MDELFNPVSTSTVRSDTADGVGLPGWVTITLAATFWTTDVTAKDDSLTSRNSATSLAFTGTLLTLPESSWHEQVYVIIDDVSDDCSFRRREASWMQELARPMARWTASLYL